MYLYRVHPQRQKGLIVLYTHRAKPVTNSTRNIQLCTVQGVYSACTVHLTVCKETEREKEREREGKRVYVLFSEKLFYPTHAINQLQTKQPLSNRDVLLPPSCWCTNTLNAHPLNVRRRHTLSHTPLRFSYSRVFLLSPSVPGGLNQMRQERKAMREKESFS